MNKANKKVKSIEYTKKIVLTAMFAATITGGKFALMALPNIEVVTLLIMLYTYTFGFLMGLGATLIFVVIETFLFSFNTWVISYLIHWPLVCILTGITKRLIDKNKVIVPALIACIITALFGLLTSLVDTLVFTTPDLYLKMFVATYVRGILFFITHIVSNTLVVGLGFLPLSKVLTRLKNQFLFEDKEVKVPLEKPLNCMDFSEETMFEKYHDLT